MFPMKAWLGGYAATSAKPRRERGSAARNADPGFAALSPAGVVPCSTAKDGQWNRE